MKNYYATFEGKCYAFARKMHRDGAVSAYGFKSITATAALRQFGYTDSCSRYVIDCIKVPQDTTGAHYFVVALTSEWIRPADNPQGGET